LTPVRKLASVSAGLSFVAGLLIEMMLMPLKASAVLIPGLLDYAQVWNRGVSFGLFRQDSDAGRYFLIAVLAAIAIGVSILAWRATNRLTAAAYGLIVGGALGNLVDRAFHGAVFDYLFLHLGRLPLFVCNFPDIAISAGVALLILESFLAKEAVAADS
jgi:lipoprotein signal peptidase